MLTAVKIKSMLNVKFLTDYARIILIFILTAVKSVEKYSFFCCVYFVSYSNCRNYKIFNPKLKIANYVRCTLLIILTAVKILEKYSVILYFLQQLSHF